jgi:hypothetical protein
MPYELTFSEWDTQPGSKDAYFKVTVGGEYYRRVRVVLPWGLETMVGMTLKGQATNLEDPVFQRGFFRYAVRSIEGQLKAGAIEEAENHELHVIEIPDDNETIRLIANLGHGDKTCEYQLSESRDLFCIAAPSNDRTATRTTGRGQTAAPTSRALCKACDLPDTDDMCSHFLHPQVADAGLSTGPQRSLTGGLCDLGRPEFQQMTRCRAGMNVCWTRIVDAESLPEVESVSAQAIEEALDNLDLRWQLAYKQPLLRVGSLEGVSVLALPCGSRDEFDRHMNSFADLLKHFDIPDDMFPEGSKLPDGDQTLVRLGLLLKPMLGEEDAEQLGSAIRVLQQLAQIRAGAAHTGKAASQRVIAAESLGIPLDGRWDEAWERVRASASRALRDIGAAVRRAGERRKP